MDNLKVVEALRKPASEVMKTKKILASFIIASSLYYLNSVTENDAAVLFRVKNIMKRKCIKRYNSDFIVLESEKERGKLFKQYDSYEDCIYDWLLGFRSSLIREIWDFDTLIRKLSNPDFTKANLKPYIDAYKLNEFDKEILSEMYCSQQTNIIEANAVSKNARVYQDLTGYKSSIPIDKPVSKVNKQPETPKKAKEKRVLKYTKNERCIVKSANLFADVGSNTAKRSFSGNVWLYDGNEVNGRYAVVLNKDHLNKGREYIDGYIKKHELK